MKTKVDFENRQGENEFCGAQLSGMPFFEKCWIAALCTWERERSVVCFFFSFQFHLIFIKIQDLQNKEFGFLDKSGIKMSSGLCLVLPAIL